MYYRWKWYRECLVCLCWAFPLVALDSILHFICSICFAFLHCHKHDLTWYLYLMSATSVQKALFASLRKACTVKHQDEGCCPWAQNRWGWWISQLTAQWNTTEPVVFPLGSRSVKTGSNEHHLYILLTPPLQLFSCMAQWYCSELLRSCLSFLLFFEGFC